MLLKLKHFSLLAFVILFFSCNKDNTSIQFSEINILQEKKTIIEINIPKAIGNSNASKTINSNINKFVCDALHLNAAKEKKETLEESMDAFNDAHADFNSIIASELKGELPIWEALIDGEVIYQNENIICIAINSSINTGAANSTMVLQFFNFDPKSGAILATNDLVKNLEKFNVLVKRYFEKEINSTYNDAENILNDNIFKLPNTLGFSEEGIILLYDNFETNSFSKELVEFIIPYEVANDYLKI